MTHAASPDTSLTRKRRTVLRLRVRLVSHLSTPQLTVEKVPEIILGLFRWETLVSMAGALPIVAAGLFLGGRMQARFSQRVFVWVISALLIASGAGLLFKG